MRHPVTMLLAALLLMSGVAVAAAQDQLAIDSEEAFRAWRSATPFEPTAEETGDALAHYCDSDLSERPEAERLATAAFFGGIFSRQPEVMDALIERFVRGGPELARGMTLYALWLTETEESRERLVAIREEKGPAHVRFFAARLLQTPNPIGPDAEISIGMQLDMLWGRYMGARTERPVERVIEALGRAMEEDAEGIDVALVRSAASKSLALMAQRFEQVLDVCRAHEEEAESAELRSALGQIIETATRRRGEQASG